MSNLEKAKERLRALPKDYTYSEARKLLTRLGFNERNIMEYRGFKTTPKFDGQIYFGKLEGITDLVTIEADNLFNFEREFKLAVEDYLEFRQEITPQAKAC